MDKTDFTKPMHDTREDSLSPTERQKILYDWNDTAFDYPRHLTLHDLISAQAGRTPDKIAVVYETEQLTYRELEQRSNQLARYLIGRGVGVESLAGIYMDRSAEMIVGILGILKAGGAYVPIDPELPPARIQMMMEDASPAVVLTQEELLSNLDTERTATVCMDRDWPQIAAEPTDPLSVEMTSRNLAYVVYTSGSTGRPKGAQNEHRAAVNLMHSMARRVGITADDVILATTTISFDPSVWEIFLPLTTGATLIVAPQESMIDGARLQRIIEDNGVTFMRSTPTGWRIYLETGWRGTDGLKVLSGGEKLTLDLARELQQRSAVLWHTYGPAEAAVFCTMGVIPPDAEVVSIGRPHDNIRTYILDEALEPVAVGAIGELYIAGDGVGRGYHNRSELTSQRFLPEPFVSYKGEEQPRMYRTGDLARFLPDGQIVFVGRNDSQVKLHGRRIELGDIEAAIHRHPAIAQNLVLAREDTPGDVRLVAYLVPRPGRKAPDAGEMRHFLGRTLPAYMTPARFVGLERFPVSPNGKIDRLALPAPDRRGDEFEDSYAEPRTQREARMAALFAEVLNLERVSVTQSFFDLGGNSLLAARLIYRVQDTFDVKVTLRDFFAEPTVSGLSKTVDSTSRQGERAVGSEPAAAASTNGALAAPQQADALLEQSNLTQNQFLMWLGQQMNPDVPLYNVVHAFTIHGALEPVAFGRAFQAFADHHDALRTIFRTINGVPRQEVLNSVEAVVEFIDLSQEVDPDAAYRAFEAERKMRILPLDEPLFDCVLLKLADDRTVWYLGQHHIMTDAISAELAFERVAAYYQLALDDRLGDIAEPPQYRAFVDYERGLRLTAAHQDALAYWREKYGQPLPPTEFYGQTAPEASFHTERMTYRLGKRRSDNLRTIARQAGFASPSEDMSLFTIFATLLFATIHRLNGQQTMRVGTPFHGRPTTEAMDIIGLFIELGAIQVDVGEGETFVSLGEQVMAETLEGLAHVQPGMSSAEANSAFDMVLNFIQSSYGEFAGLPVTKEPTHTNHIDAAHNLRLQIIDYDNSGDFVLLFDLKTELFGPSERSWLVEHFVRVLDAFIDNPTRSLGDFSLMNEIDRERLLVKFNDTDAAYPADRTVVALFEEQAARSPEQVAVVDGDVMLTYKQLNERANRLAHFLTTTYNVGPGSTVAICLPRSIDALVAIWAVLKAGGAYVPIDPTYPEERIAFMVADAGPGVVLTRDVEAISPLVSATVVDPAGLDLTGCVETNPETTAAPDDLAYMIYTSGSTGKPKGAMITHRGLLNYAWWARRVYQEDGPLDFPLYSSLAFDLTVTSIFVPLLSGGRIVVYGESPETPGLEILSVVGDDQVDIVKLTPAHLGLLRELNLSNLRIRKLIVGGEDFKTELARDIDGLFNGQVEQYNEYGPTEATVACMLHRFDVARDTAVSVPIGTPAANARIYLLDQYDQPVPPGVVGEMVISSDGVARGYHNRPELTAERFAPDPFCPGARLYRTGDVARWSEAGQMVFLGRRDHQVKIGGARIELGEVEARLRAHPAIKDAVVSVVQFERRMDESDVTYCTRCGLSSNYPDVTFNSDGVCNLCTDFDTFRSDVFQYFKTEDDLMQIVADAKAGRTGDYDCMMLYSGGKDSTYVLSQLVEMGLEVLAFSLDNGYISEDALDNVRRVTDHLGVDLVIATTPHMNAIFNDSLERHSNVCQGCYKVIYTLSMKLAREKGIRYIFTGLSRGQLFETRLDELFRNRIFDVAQMDRAILEARKVYHRVDDAVRHLLDVSMFTDDRVFNEIQFVDYFRYTDVELDDIYGFLSTRVPWIRPRDTGRSTNCLINEAGIFVHKTEQGYHNYALPYSWDVRLGHKTRDEVMQELDDDIRPVMVRQMLDEVGYTVKTWRAEQSVSRLAAYYVSDDVSLTVAELRAYLSEHLPAYMIPSYFVRLESLPLTSNGKVDRHALPSPTEKRPEMDAAYVEPQAELEVALAEFWSDSLNVSRIGLYDDFFDLGGASIAAVQVVVKISESFGVDFPISSFFEHPTIAGQSAVLEALLIDQLESMSDEEAAALLAELGE